MSLPDFSDILSVVGLTSAEHREIIGGGRNSRVYRVVSGDGSVVLKHYHQDTSRPNPRQKREYHGLSFLWTAGVRSIPRPIYNDFERAVLVMSLLPGTPALQTMITVGDARAAAAFLETLRTASKSHEAMNLGNASEAAFTRADLLKSIEKRLRALATLPSGASDAHRAAAEFVKGMLTESFHDAAEEASESVSATLPRSAQTLSPSDFGFHNAVRAPNGSLSFVDFEHFGWDDPAKTIADFVLHPGMRLDDEVRHTFVAEVIGRFSDNDPALASRTRSFGSLYAVKWATILLNEFLPQAAARRRFASSHTTSDEEALFHQLDKAREILADATDFAERAGL